MPETCPTGTADEFTSLPLSAVMAAEAGLLRDVELAAGGLRLRAELGFQPGTPIPPRGWTGVAALAADPCGLLWLIDPGGQLWSYDATQDRVEDIPCLPRFPAPLGLAVSEGTLYLAHGTATGQHQITALARMNWQVRWTWAQEGAQLGDLAVDRCDHLYVLDGAYDVVRVLDAGGRQVRTLGAGALTDPRRLSLGQDGNLYLLDGAQAIRLQRTGEELHRIDLVFPGERGVAPASVTADASGVLLIGDGQPLTGEDERVIHRFTPDGTLLDPLTGYLGPAFQLVWGKDQQLYVVGEQDTIIPLTPLVRFRRQGSFFLPPFDAGHPDILWHKVLLVGERPDGTEIRVRFLISNEARTVQELQALPDTAWSEPLVNFTDALIPGDNVIGRYLAIRGELATNNVVLTPSLDTVIAVFPRQSFLRYLPPVYQDDPGSKAFLERFLSIFESLTRRLDGDIDGTPGLLDPAATPGTFLPWLASWLSFGLDDGWSESQQRQFLAEAMTLYKQRGTRQGISRVVELVTGRAPLIVELFQLACLQDPALRREYALLYGGEDCHFCLLLEPQVSQNPQTAALVRRVVEEQVPAHTQAGILALRPWFHLGLHTYLEINTHLSTPAIRLEESVLGGGETVLIDREDAGQVERKARIGVDTTLS